MAGPTEFQTVPAKTIEKIKKLTNVVRGSLITPMFDALQTEFETKIPKPSEDQLKNAHTPDNGGGAFDF